MRRWGVVITGFYALIVVGLLVPGAVVLTGDYYMKRFDTYTPRKSG
jgi:hypothetical protein